MMVAVALALHAGSWNIAYFSVGKGQPVADLIDPHPVVTDQLVGVVFPEGYVVLGHARYHTSATASAFVEINHHAVLVFGPVPFMMLVRFVMCLCHGYPSRFGNTIT
jgi:hypothetical protein